MVDTTTAYGAANAKEVDIDEASPPKQPGFGAHAGFLRAGGTPLHVFNNVILYGK